MSIQNMLHKHRNYIKRLSSFPENTVPGRKTYVHPDDEPHVNIHSGNRQEYEFSPDVPLGHQIHIVAGGDGQTSRQPSGQARRTVQILPITRNGIEKKNTFKGQFDVTQELLPNLFKGLHHLYKNHPTLTYEDTPHLLGDSFSHGHVKEKNKLVPFVERYFSSTINEPMTSIKAGNHYDNQQELEKGLHQIFSGLILHKLRDLPKDSVIRYYLQDEDMLKERDDSEEHIPFFRGHGRMISDFKNNPGAKEEARANHTYSESILRQYSPILRDYISHIFSTKDSKEILPLANFIENYSSVNPDLRAMLSELFAGNPELQVGTGNAEENIAKRQNKEKRR